MAVERVAQFIRNCEIPDNNISNFAASNVSADDQTAVDVMFLSLHVIRYII